MRRRCWLLLPALFIYTFDIGLTLLGQPEYWAGDWSKPSELNPIAAPLLKAGPIWFVVAAVAWAGFSTFVLFVRLSVARPAAWLIAFAHSIGASTWLVRHGVAGWVAAIGLLVTAAWLVRYCWRRSLA